MSLNDPKRALVRYSTIVSDSARWEGFAFRDGDIIISTPAKCGTTWTQMICALLVFQTPELPRPLDELSPWLDMLTRSRDETFAILDTQQHRRFIKTHTPLDGLPFHRHVTYICVGRDPRDVALSMLHHRSNFDFIALLTARERAVGLDDVKEKLAQGPPVEADSEYERFWEWIDNSEPVISSGSSLSLATHHVNTFWEARDEPNVVMLHYDDLLSDLAGQMRSLAEQLDIDLEPQQLPLLVAAARFDSMRSNADKLVPDISHNLWQSNEQFFHQGSSGQWRTLLSDTDLDRYRQTVAPLLAEQASQWLHSS